MNRMITYFILTISTLAMSQNQRSTGDSLDQRISSIAHLNLGNMGNVIAGNTNVPLGSSYLSNGYPFVAAIDPSGFFYIWNYTMITLDPVTITSVITTQSKDIVVIGYIDASVMSIGGTPYDIVVFRFTSAGTLLWSKIYHTPKFEEAFDLVEDAQRNLHIVGSCTGFGAGAKDVSLLSITANGDFLYFASYGTELNEWGTDIDIAKNGNFVISGTVETINNGKDQLFVEVNPNYSLVRMIAFGREKDDEADEIEVLSNGELRLVGYVTGFGQGGKDISVIPILPTFPYSGSILTHLYSGINDERAWSFAGNIHSPSIGADIKRNVIVGYTESTSGVGQKDAVVLEIDYAGSIYDSYVYKTQYDEELFDVVDDTTVNKYYYGGVIHETPLTYSDNLLWGSNDYDDSNITRNCRFLFTEVKLKIDTLPAIESKTTPIVESYPIRIDADRHKFDYLNLGCGLVTAEDQPDIMDVELSVYPNPLNTNTLSIKGLTDDFDELKIVNQLGETIYTSSSTDLIDCSYWKSGLYMLKVIDPKGSTKSRKFIKE